MKTKITVYTNNHGEIEFEGATRTRVEESGVLLIIVDIDAEQYSVPAVFNASEWQYIEIEEVDEDGDQKNQG